MYYYLVAPTVLVRKDEDTFTYQSEKPLAVGTLVRVSVGRKVANGLIVGATKKPSFTTKNIESVLAARPIPTALVELARWMSTYYAAHLALVLQAMLPTGAHKKRRQSQKVVTHPSRNRTKIVLNKEQSRALLIANRHHGGALLLHGVTGSGKTQVYIEAAKHEKRQGRSSIILVPEISLTPQLVAEFAHHFKKIVVAHSGMTEAERHTAWSEVLEADEPVVVIGPRSALFMPVANLGLIAVDECHEPSYKQEQAPKYSALRAASMLVRFHTEAKVLLGSATPAVADFYLAKTNKNPILKLQQTAAKTTPPTVTVVDLKKRDDFREHRFLSDSLVAAIRQALMDERQIMLFHNRRGTAPTTLCVQCGWTALCSHCNMPMTLHADQHKLICHLCGRTNTVPPSCPACGHPDITFRGIGTKLIEDEARKLFPKARIARFDADNSSSETLQARYQQLYDGEVDLMIGTQLLAKGLDLPKLGVVGVVQADSGLQLPDYLAEERVFQLLYQVAGRVGRGKQSSTVVVQTYQPEHPIVQRALARDYQGFYEQELGRRQDAGFPPFTHLLKLTCTYKTETGAIRAAQKMTSDIKKIYPSVTIVGPLPSFYERLGGNYRWQLILKSKQRANLVAIAKEMPQQWQADLDPASLL